MNGWIWFGTALAGLGALVLLAVFMGRVLRGPCTQEREAVENAPAGCDEDVFAGPCIHGVRIADACPRCHPLPACAHCGLIWCKSCVASDNPAVGRASVVASEDLAWQVDLARFYMDYDTYRTELRMPGEGR